MAAPYGLSQTAVGLIFLISLVGILTAAWVGDLAGRIGRGRLFPILVVLIAIGVWTTLASGIPAILGGTALATFAFYGAHTVASSWVGIAARNAKAQASSLYLFAYYTGSSLWGWCGGLAWMQAGWGGVVLLCSGLLGGAFLLSLLLPRPAAPLARGSSPPEG